MAEPKVPLGVRIYDFIYGKDYPFKKGELERRTSTAPGEGASTPMDVGAASVRRVDRAEEAALRDADPDNNAQRKTNYATGGLVQALHQARGMRKMYATGGIVNRYDPSPKAEATGGPVVGPGGPTSDSVPIKASNGEFVVDAATTHFFGPEFFQFLMDYAKKMAADEASGAGVQGGNQFAGLAGDTPGVGVDEP